MIERIGFKNFKCLSGKFFNLSKLNIFTGYNGRGKSSVMQALLMLSQSVRKNDMNSIAHLHVNGDFVKLGDFDELLSNTDFKKLPNEDIPVFANETKPGALTVTKQAEGAAGDEVFTFEISLTNEYGQPLDDVNIITDN